MQFLRVRNQNDFLSYAKNWPCVNMACQGFSAVEEIGLSWNLLVIDVVALPGQPQLFPPGKVVGLLFKGMGQ